MTDRFHLRARDFDRFAYVAAGALLLALPAADASAAPGFYWADNYHSSDSFLEPPPVRRMRPVTRPRKDTKAEKAASEGSKPQGPLVIAVSIQRQQVKVYDSRGLFAESAISTGMPGHATPMGVFSVIQKHKFHRSNIYSGAPMPYMQRITWSGVAMHAGVLPGYPASHGCIRMPMSFARKMWGWTRMGARVVVTVGEVSPAPFTHAALDALVPPAPATAPEASSPMNVKTADASGTVSMGSSKVMADASFAHFAERAEAADQILLVTSGATGVATAESAAPEKVSEHGSARENSDADFDISDGGPPMPRQSLDSGNVVEVVAGKATLEALDPFVETTGAVAAAATLDQPKATAAAAENSLSPPPIPSAPLAPTVKRADPVAIFVSRKDGKIYVRQNFKPLFDTPIEIAPGGSLGTHVFTAGRGDSEGALQWSVVSLPSSARQASARVDGRPAKSQRSATEPARVVDNSPAEALARLAIPAEMMVRLGQALQPGSSLVVSDQAIAAGETGEGTDFIVRLR